MQDQEEINLSGVFNDSLNHTRWRAVSSRKLLGSHAGRQFYQWYLSVYQREALPNFLRYQSPANGGPLSAVRQPKGSKMWSPTQRLRIVGKGEFVRFGWDDLVVETHDMAADCGAGTVWVFGSDAREDLLSLVSVRNRCELQASVVDGKNGLDAIALSGPYYGPHATKPNACATLSYTHGKWVETPDYFPFYVGKLPPKKAASVGI